MVNDENSCAATLYDGFEDVAAAQEGSIAPYTPNDLWLPFINDGTTTEKNCLVLLVGCKIFVSKLSPPSLEGENGNELQSAQPPVFFVQVELDDEHFYDRVKTKFVFRFQWHARRRSVFSLFLDLVIMFTYLWRLVLICGPFPVVLRELLLDTGTTRISVGVYLKKPER